MESRGQEKFMPTKYLDPVFSVLFLAHVAAVATWVGYAGATGAFVPPADDLAVESRSTGVLAFLQGRQSSHVSQGTTATVLVLLGLASAAVAAAGFLLALRLYPTGMVTCSLMFWVVTIGLSGLALLFSGNAVGGALSLVLCAAMGCMIMASRERIKFTGECLRCVSNVYTRQPQIFLVTFGMVLLQALWLALSAASALPLAFGASRAEAAAQKAEAAGEARPGNPYAGFMLLSLLSFYWGAQVFSNILHVTIAGVVGRWYFGVDQERAVSRSSGQAFTNYLGPICMGSLLVAILQLLSAIAKKKAEDSREQGRNGNAVVNQICACLARCLERLAEIFNTYAFIMVAIYGIDYISAGKRVMGLAPRSGFEILIATDFSGITCSVASLAAACVVTAVVGLSAAAAQLPQAIIAGVCVITFLTTYTIMSIVSRVVVSGCETLFVCYAEDSARLKNADDELFGVFNERQRLQ
eukprot:TRINITY_DN16782_c0_g1_i1.p1 TRINITY_DN16782_c0_g1~~TRINITY_DN16782_c0_g1_i1.p1  ORF type:complete len:494 (+),score=103.37 TRINITY_DN16782_c0_g1_i1:78-1484(+)